MHGKLIKLWSATCQTCYLLQAPALPGQFQEAFARRLVYCVEAYALGKVWSPAGGCEREREVREDVTCLVEADKR